LFDWLDYEPAALEFFVKRQKLRVLRIPGFSTFPSAPEIKAVSGGVLLQHPNPPIKDEDAKNWKVVTTATPTGIFRHYVVFSMYGILANGRSPAARACNPT